VIAAALLISVACTPAQLHASFAGSNGYAGTTHIAYSIRNGGRACTLFGYPHVRLLDLRGRRQVGVHHDGRDVLPGAPPRLVRLPHGARAGLVLAVADGPIDAQPAWTAGLAEIRIGNGWLRLGKLGGYGDLYESPFLARVPKV
jgi:uncharacterized protein DUF4232